MPRLLHVADLHLTAGEPDRAYALAVLEEIASHAATLHVDALVIAGHLTGSMAELLQLGPALRSALSALPCPAFYVAGIGEQPPTVPAALRDALSGVTLLEAAPFSLEKVGDGPNAFELLAIGHRPTYRGYHDWAVPAKEAPHRVLIAHAPVAGIPCRDVDAAAALDPDLFARFAIDYAALGGVHVPPEPSPVGEALVAYPGAARVTDRCELGPRIALLVELADIVTLRPVPLTAAGQYQRCDAWVDGQLADNPSIEAWGPHDRIDLRLAGVVPSDAAAEALAAEAQRRWSERVRRLKVDASGLVCVTDPSAVAIARRFHRECETQIDGSIASRAWHLGVRLLGSRTEPAP